MISRNKDCVLAAFVDVQTKEKLELEQFSAPLFSSLEALLASDVGQEIDVITIATPNGYHADQAMKCLDAKKHVVLEKPIALYKADAEKVIYKALQVRKQVFAVMQNRYSPPSVWLKQLLEKGILGKIFLVQINCFWNRDERYYKKESWHGKKELDGGTLFTQFSHFIDLIYWCFGDITNIRARFRDFNHQELTDFEDSGVISFDFVNGGMGCLNYSTAVWDKNLESHVTVIAEKGSLKVGGQYMNEVEYCHIKDYTMPELTPVNPDNSDGTYKGSAANLHYIIENVVEVLRHGGELTTNVLEGMKVVDIIERIYQQLGR